MISETPLDSSSVKDLCYFSMEPSLSKGYCIIALLEQVQHRDTKMVSGLRNVTHELPIKYLWFNYIWN